MSDRNFQSHADVKVHVIGERIEPPDPENWDDTLKLSHVVDSVVEMCSILGSKEDCIDIMRGSVRLHVYSCELYPTGKFAVTVKGGCMGIVLENIVIYGAGKETDIDIGNWTAVNFDKTTDVFITNVRRADGKPVRVRVGHATKPIIEGGNVKIDHLGSLLLKAYWWGRFALHKLGFK
jgi:hypothetical protein